MSSKYYYIYILTNKINTVLYSGVSGNLTKRVHQHRHKTSGFTAKYNVHKLVHYEIFDESYEAIKREKQLKAGSRRKKIELINKFNPEWRDLYDELA